MKVKGEINELKRSVEVDIESLKFKAQKILELGDESRSAMLLKIVAKLQEWQKK